MYVFGTGLWVTSWVIVSEDEAVCSDVDCLAENVASKKSASVLSSLANKTL